MLEPETSALRPSSYELQLRAHRDRNLLMSALLRHALRKLAAGICRLARESELLARNLAAEWRLRHDMRALKPLDDRTLTDIGLVRGDIKYVVSIKRPRRAIRNLQQHDAATRISRGCLTKPQGYPPADAHPR
jgi:uncharacterized protein YjiS (DUF1127 family)